MRAGAKFILMLSGLGTAQGSSSLAAPTLNGLSAATDSGASSSDSITTNTTPDVSISWGTDPIQNDVIEIRDNGVLVVSHTVTALEAGSVPLTILIGLTLAEGSHPLTCRHTRGATASAWSNTLTVVIDLTAPVLSSPTGTKTGQTTATLGFTSNEAGTAYGVLTLTSSSPNKAQIKAGQNAAGAAAAFPFNQAAVVGAGNTKAATGLTAGATYFPYYMEEDLAGNQSNIAAASSFTTDPPAFSITYIDKKLDTVGGTAITYASITIGATATNRRLYFPLWARMGATATVNKVECDFGSGFVLATQATIGGGAASTIAGQACSDIWYIDAPAGTTVIPKVTYNGSTLESGIACYVVVTPTMAPTASDHNQSTSAQSLAKSLAIPAGGGLIGVYGYTGGSQSVTWSGTGVAPTKDVDTDIGSRHFSAAHDTADAGTAPTITASDSFAAGNRNLSIVAVGP